MNERNETMTGRIIQLDRNGDTVRLAWDTTTLTAALVAEAEAIIAKHRARGGLVFAVTEPTGQRRGAQLTAFDPTLPEILLAPRLVGG
jgi:hypothetical protein